MASRSFPRCKVLRFGGALFLASCGNDKRVAVDSDPRTGKQTAALSIPGWSAGAPLTVRRAQHAAVLLPTGKLLVVNGINESGPISGAVLYDPAVDWSSTGGPGLPATTTRAVLLSSGKVFVVTDASRTGRLYDPLTGAWSATGVMLEESRVRPSPPSNPAEC